MKESLQWITKRLRECDVDFALLGGLAVSARTDPRFTRDIDLAIAVGTDRGAEQVVSCRGKDLLQEYELVRAKHLEK